MDEGTTSPTAQRNIDTILAWLDAHNRRDMKAIDCPRLNRKRRSQARILAEQMWP
jgi:hypothetical protein